MFFCFSFALNDLVGQEKEEEPSQRYPELAKSRPIPAKEIPKWMRFVNTDKILYYENKSALKAIQEATEKNNLHRAKKLLTKYVASFGIDNFSRDTELLWRLAKLTELLDGLEAAKPIYQLILRHHHENIDLRLIEPYTDKLNEKEIGSYVPLDYYYELIERQRYVDTLYAPRNRVLNMGDLINSNKADYAPFYDNEKKLLFYTSKRDLTSRNQKVMYDENVYVASKESDLWQLGMPLAEINTKSYNEGSVCLSPDGKKLYFSRCNAPDGLGGCDLYVAFMSASGRWVNVSNLGRAINSEAWDSHPMLSPSGDTLYFSSDRAGGYGLSDIYFSVQGKDNIWSKARNLGPIINTRNSEVSPFISHNEGKVLYFSSNGQIYNFGGFDIYKSYWNGKYWEAPLNTGPLVNGIGSEHYFTLNDTFSHIYYAKSSSQNLQDQDLYAFPLPMGSHPKANTLLRGTVINEENKKPIQGIVSIIDLDKGIEIAPKFLSPGGSFSFHLIDNRNYLLVIQGDNFLRIEELFYLSGDTELTREVTPVSRKIAFKSIEFGTGESALTQSMKRDLGRLVDFLGEQENYVLDISGHTDSKGNPERNILLSKQRADAISSYIASRGIAEDRVTSAGFGSTRPIVEEKTEEDRAINRRVEFHIYDPEAPVPEDEIETPLEEEIFDGLLDEPEGEGDEK